MKNAKNMLKGLAKVLVAAVLAFAMMPLTGYALGNPYEGTTWYKAGARVYEAPRMSFADASIQTWTEAEYCIDLSTISFTDDQIREGSESANYLPEVTESDWDNLESNIVQSSAYEYQVGKDGTASISFLGGVMNYEIREENGKKVLYERGELWGYANRQDAIDAAYAEAGI